MSYKNRERRNQSEKLTFRLTRVQVAVLTFTFVGGLAAGGIAFAQAVQQTIPDDLHLLVGKHVVVGRMPLCVPNTYTANLSYAGKPATVVSFKENTTMTKLSPSILNRMAPSARALMEDAAKGGILEFQFQDGTKLDTCVVQGVSALAPNLELAAGETITRPVVSAAGASPLLEHFPIILDRNRS